ncbi:nucleotide-binding protein [Gordonia amicalis]|uniref:TIR domain-containing protein n=1 Tax=Gordonia TaxID=2053 RepID=UPI0004649B25|nr:MULTISPECIES: TIR domain-containing protein [Gordonia]UPW12539.1 nucleotide-binding protein [Gordonia amicalis]
MATKDEVVNLLTGHYGLTISGEKDVQNGVQLITSQGPKVVVYHSGKVVAGGSKSDLIADLKDRLNGVGGGTVPKSRKVFVVYGHDSTARTQLEAIIRRWNLEPILLDQLTNEGATLIEKLERAMDEAVFAIVLVTPDDEGHPKDRPDEKKYRARQNVVLELGMMLRGLGREQVAILMPTLTSGVMERPSDIDGLMYIPYKDTVEDAKVLLAKELNGQGLSIDLNTL